MDLIERENNKKCIKCKQIIRYKDTDIFWDEKGFGYSAKLIKCNICGCINVIKYIQDKSIDLNNDEKYYK